MNTPTLYTKEIQNRIFSVSTIRPRYSVDRRLAGRVWRWSAILLLTLSLAFVAYKGTRLGVLAWQIHSQATGIVTLAQADLSPQGLIALSPQISGLAHDLAALEREAAFAAPLLRSLDGVTVYGATLAALPDLLTAGAALSRVAADGAALLAPMAQAEQPGIALAQAVADQPALFTRMAQDAERANLALMQISPDSLHPALSGPVAELHGGVSVLAPALRMAPAIPTLLGMNGAVRFLVLMQNNHELRGTGGLISAVGELTVENAQLSDLKLSDAYDIFDPEIVHPMAPEPMRRYMGIEYMTMRDANWSPDLPTSAQSVRHLYYLHRGESLDGVVTLDLRAVQLVIDGLGGIRLQGVDELITGANVVEIIQELWANPQGTEAGVGQGNWREWYGQRKDFIPNLAGAILHRLTSGEASMLRVAFAAQQALADRSVQIWFSDRGVMAELAPQGWDGALHPRPGQDYLSLVETNVGYNKVNAVVERSVRYSVTWPDGPDAPGLATLAVEYVHPIQKPGHVCDITPRYGDSYEEMFARCYFNYVRLYVPRGSELIQIEGVEPDSIQSIRGEQRTQIFSGYMVMRPGESHTVTFTYRLPAQIGPNGYELVVQRQAGMAALPFTFVQEDGRQQQELIRQNWMNFRVR